MFSGYITSTPQDALPYRVIVRRDGHIVRAQAVQSMSEGARRLDELLRRERADAGELAFD
jgi:hypothetical protein